MTDETAKTPLDHVNDLTMQLKEMRHYSKNNVELLTAQWLRFDEGKLKKLGESKRIEDLMMRQSEFHDALEAAITELDQKRGQRRYSFEADMFSGPFCGPFCATPFLAPSS